MSIVFDTLAGGDSQGALNATLPRINASLQVTATVGLRASLPEAVSNFIGEVSTVAPSFIGFDVTLPNPSAQFLGYYEATGTFNAVLPAARSSFYEGSRFEAVIPPSVARFATGGQASIYTNLTFASLMAGEYAAPTINEGMLVTDHSTSDWAIVLADILSMSDAPAVYAKLAATLEDSILARETFTIVFQMLAAEEVAFDASSEANLRMIYLLAEQLSLSDEAVGFYNALVLITSAVMLGEQITPGLDSRLEDQIALTDEMAAVIKAIVEVIEEMAFEDEQEAVLLLYALLEDNAALSSDPSALVAMITELLDTAQLGVHVTTGAGDTFIGYSVNTRVAAVSEYANYPFNSFALIGGVPFASADDGIYELGGKDDDGAPIHASVYTGLSDFGSSVLKRVPNAWIGLTCDGEMVLKVVTADEGRKKENWYRMSARPQGTPVDSRFEPAKGLIGRYWGFKLENIDGADFQLDSLKIWPLAMTRRYSGR